MQSDASLENRTTRKVLWRIIPLIFTLYIVSYIDRANIGYAALQMNQELALSGSAFGFAFALTRFVRFAPKPRAIVSGAQ